MGERKMGMVSAAFEWVKVLLGGFAFFLIFCCCVFGMLPEIMEACAYGLKLVATRIKPLWNKVRRDLYEETVKMLYLAASDLCAANDLCTWCMKDGKLALSHVKDKLNKLAPNGAILAIEGPNDAETFDPFYFLIFCALICMIALLLDCKRPAADGNNDVSDKE